MPVKLALGVNTGLPPASSATVPLTGLCTDTRVRVSPLSTSVSLASRAAAVMVIAVSSSVVARSLTATGASLTGAIVKRNTLGVGSRSTPPLAMPPLSRTWKVNWPRLAPLTLKAGVKVRVAICAAVSSWPAVTGTPATRNTPSAVGGRLMITTDCRALAGVSLGSVKPKSDAAKEYGVSSVAATVRSVPAGASLTGVTVMETVAVEVRPAASRTV